MPTRITGLKGYVAEAVVERWLLRKYAEPQFEIVRQVIPTDVDKRGGGYLDFCVVEDGLVTEVYEVKGQDYIFGRDSEVNKPLLHMWNNQDNSLGFVTQDGSHFPGVTGAKGFIVLLAPPNEDWIEKIGVANIQFVKLFRDVWVDMESGEEEAEFIEDIMRDAVSDLREVVSVLKKPTQGATKLGRFLELRDGGG